MVAILFPNPKVLVEDGGGFFTNIPKSSTNKVLLYKAKFYNLGSSTDNLGLSKCTFIRDKLI